MTIHLESEVVATAFDPQTRVHSYTVGRGGKRWTVAIPDTELEKFGPIFGAQAGTNKARRRMYLARRLETAMGGPEDKPAVSVRLLTHG